MALLRISLLWLAGLLALGVTWWTTLRRPPDRSPAELATARAVAAHLEGFVDEQATVVREIADRIGGWESMPEAAVAGVLRVAATRHLALRRLLVADPAGRLVSGYDAGRPVGAERLPAGALDRVLGRREVLRERTPVLVLPSSEAGTLRHLWLAAAIQRGDGSRPGYVGATLSLAQLRRVLQRIAPPGVRLTVTTPAGHLVVPCRSGGSPGGTRVVSRRFVVRVAATARPDLLPALLITLLLFPVLLISTLVFRRLDRPSQMGRLEDV